MLRLRDIMTADVIAVETTTTLRDAAELLAEQHVGGLPVVEGGVLAGVVSATDILAFTAATPPEPRDDADEPALADDDALDLAAWDEEEEPSARFFTDRWAAAADDVDERFADGRLAEAELSPHDVLAEHTVEEIMTRDVVSLPPDADVASAARRMREAEVHRLLVVEGDTLVGIVTTMDVVRAVAEGRVGRRTLVFPRAGRRGG
jgi:CBS domain-containing protein